MPGLRESLKKRFSRAYDRLVEKSRIGDDVPPRVQRYYNNVTGYEYAVGVESLIGSAGRVLLVGDGGGRDFFWLRHQGRDVVTLDITPQPVIPGLIMGDVTRGLPFRDATFGAVVMAEVIEHLFEDLEALREVRRVLTPDGALVLTVPFGNDTPEYHVRVHTDKTIRRLLNYGGFEVEQVIYKGGGWAALDNGGLLTVAKHFAALATFAVSGKSIYPQMMKRFAESDFKAGRKPAWRHRISPLFGGMIRAVPTEDSFDVRALNRGEFEDHLGEKT